MRVSECYIKLLGKLPPTVIEKDKQVYLSKLKEKQPQTPMRLTLGGTYHLLYKDFGKLINNNLNLLYMNDKILTKDLCIITEQHLM